MGIKMKLIKYICIALFIANFTGCGSIKEPVINVDEDRYLVIFNGNILTMEKENHKYSRDTAMMLKNDKIYKFFPTDQIEKNVTDLPNVEFLDLEGKTVMPGFIEPHAHLSLSIDFDKLISLTPCLPERYQKIYDEDYSVPDDQVIGCKNFIEESFEKLVEESKKGIFKDLLDITGWYIANGLDPSRMGYTEEGGIPSSKEYLEYPAKFIQDFVDDVDESKPFENTPVFIIDQSGHLGYINQAAFKKAKICFEDNDKYPIVCRGSLDVMKASLANAQVQYDFLDGEWGIVCQDQEEQDCTFSGLLNEESAFGPFLKGITTGLSEEDKALILGSPQSNIMAMKESLEIFSQNGLTTFVEGAVSSETMIDAYKELVTDNIPVRLLALYTWDAKAKNDKPNVAEPWQEFIEWDEYNGMLSVAGIKLWADGSTQGCSADLQEIYSIDGLCSNFDKGHQNFTAEKIAENLESFWENGWYINIHANGDQAILNSIQALESLAKFTNIKTAKLPHTLIHATVNIKKSTKDEGQSTIDAVVNARKGHLPNLSTSHLIGHVAYWGKALENELGFERGEFIDPTRTEWDKGIPVSLHSDLPITPLYPLWFVEQAVTRATWEYPTLSGEGTPLNENQALDVYQALMAVTINPAKQHRLDDKLGSLEKNKIADLVILKDNPLTVDKNEIHMIKVACTFLSGKKVEWKNNKEDFCILTPKT